MVCYCCSETGRETPSEGICKDCNMDACGYTDYNHGEHCTYCGGFFCYKHQKNHSLDAGIDPIITFPATAKKSSEIVSNFIKEPKIEDAQLAMDHGIGLANKLDETRMEEQFRNILSLVKSKMNSSAINTEEIKKLETRFNEILMNLSDRYPK